MKETVLHVLKVRKAIFNQSSEGDTVVHKLVSENNLFLRNMPDWGNSKPPLYKPHGVVRLRKQFIGLVHMITKTA